jgi:hypothetical protein
VIVTPFEPDGVKVDWPLAVKVWLTVRFPFSVVVIPEAPREMAEVLEVPSEMEPFAVAPAPALIETLPPFLVPEEPVALPPAKVNVPPVELVVPDWPPAAIVTPAPVPVPAVERPGWMPMFVAVPAEAVVISGFWLPASVITPAVETFKLEDVTANVPPELPIATFPEVEASDVAPVEVKAVKVPAAGVEAPIVVPLIDPPVIATLLAFKLLAVTAPAIVTVSSAEPILIWSATELSVPILIVFPAFPVPILTVLALFPVPRLTVPVVPESSVKALVPVEVIVPAPANPKAVAEVD